MRKKIDFKANNSVGTQSCQTPRHASMRPDATRPFYVWVLDSSGEKRFLSCWSTASQMRVLFSAGLQKNCFVRSCAETFDEFAWVGTTEVPRRQSSSFSNATCSEWNCKLAKYFNSNWTLGMRRVCKDQKKTSLYKLASRNEGRFSSQWQTDDTLVINRFSTAGFVPGHALHKKRLQSHIGVGTQFSR